MELPIRPYVSGEDCVKFQPMSRDPIMAISQSMRSFEQSVWYC